MGDDAPATVTMKNPGQQWTPGASVEIPPPAVEWDRGEPYLQASADVRVTPFRDDDAEPLVSGRKLRQRQTALFSHPLVDKYSYGRPSPYTVDAARQTINESRPGEELIRTLADKGVVDTNPFMAIRYRGQLVGDINVFNRNDGRGVFGVTFDLHPDFHRRGIGLAAGMAVLGWCARGMEASKLEAYAESVNAASAGLLARLGLTKVNEITAPWPVVSGGGQRQVTVWQRELPTPAPWIAVPAPAPPPPPMNLEGEGYIGLGGGVRITPCRDTAVEVEQMVELSNSPSVSQWTYTRASPYLAADAQATIDKYISVQGVAVSQLRAGKLASSLPFTVIRDSDDRIIGDVALYPVPYCPERLELSYALHPDVQGRGLGTRTATAVLGFAYAHMGRTSIQAYTQVLNAASSGILKKLGFVVGEERSFKWIPTKGGGWRHVLIWERELA